MPIFDYSCEKCGHVWENIEVWPSHAPKECPQCKSTEFNKVFSSVKQQVRMDSDSVLHSMPDPCPPLEELRGKGAQGYNDKPEASTRLGDYTRSKDKFGNTIWKEKKKSYFHPGMGSRKSSAEKE